MTSTDVRAWMTRSPRTIAPGTKLSAAYDTMTMNGIHHLPVLEDGKLVGLVEDRDLVIALHFADARHMTVGRIMAREPFTTTPETEIGALALEMARAVRSAAIVMEKNEVVGIFTAVDALRALGTQTLR